MPFPQHNTPAAVPRFLARVLPFSAVLVALGSPALVHAQPPAKPQTQKQRDLVRAEAALSAVQKRVALVIGNKDYADAPLKNPINDAEAMASTLKDLGFTVLLKTNLTNRQMTEAVDDFAQQLDKNTIGLFYFSGHGIQVNGVNYLVPIGYSIKRQADVAFEAFPAQRLLDTMGSAGCTLNLVILDACRNNPLPKSMRSTSDKGLGKMDAPSGTLVAYATAPGQTASDDPDKNNGLYTGVLLEKMKTPGLKIEEVFKLTRISVKATSEGKQTPWEESSLENDFYFAADAKPVVKPAPAPVPVPDPEPVPIKPVPVKPAPKPAPVLVPAVTPKKPVANAFSSVVSRFQPLMTPLLDTALKTVDEINDKSKKSIVLSRIASAQAKSGNMASAAQNVETALPLARAVSSTFDRDDALCEVSAAQAQMGDYILAGETASEVSDSHMKANAFYRLAVTQAEKGEVSAAQQTAETIVGESQKVAALTRIAEAQAAQGEVQAARQTLQAALPLIPRIVNPLLRPRAFADVAQAQAKIGDTKAAQQTIQSISDPSSKNEALCALVSVQVQSGSVGIASALQTASLLSEANYSAEALCIIAAAQARSGNAKGADQALRSASEAANSLTSAYWKDTTLIKVVLGQAQIGNTKAAQQTAQTLESAHWKAVALANIAAVQAQTGNNQAAQTTLVAAQQSIQTEPTAFIKGKALVEMVDLFYTFQYEAAKKL